MVINSNIGRVKNYCHQLSKVALALASAILVFACGTSQAPSTIQDPETTPTQVSYNHRMIESKDGKKSHRLETPILERYELAAEPFIEFKKGVKVEKFDDSVHVEATLDADYALYNEKTEIWEARGNVVGHNIKEDKWLYTEQLFWDQKRGKIYTHKRARIIDRGSIHVGLGFESDEDFEEWSFNNTSGKMEVESQDSTVTADSTTKIVNPVGTVIDNPAQSSTQDTKPESKDTAEVKLRTRKPSQLPATPQGAQKGSNSNEKLFKKEKLGSPTK